MKILKQKKYWVEHFNDEKYTQLREKILNSFKDLVFDEGPHKYYLHGKEITCVSNVTHMFKPHFDSESMAQATYERNYNNEKSKYYKMTPEMIQEEWNKISREACSHGTERHEFAESIFYFMTNQFDKILPAFKDRLSVDKETNEPIFIANDPKEEAAVTFYEELPDSLFPILAETKVYNEKLGYSGTFDLLMYYDATIDGKDDKNSGLCVMDWKGLDVNTPIFTKNKGWQTMGTVEVGDIVYDKNGEETKILHTSSVHNKKCYKIKFDNNVEIIADFDHRWEIFFDIRKRNKTEVLTTEELFHVIKSIEGNRRSNNIPKVNISKPLQTNNNCEIDPYLLGVWLGDGHSSCGMITNMYDFIFDEIKQRGFEIGDDVSKNGSGKAKTKTIYGFRGLLNKYNLLNNKHIPNEVLLSDYNYKKMVLGGLMDTDGYYNKKRKRYILSTTREYQVEFSVKLLSSMGIKTTVLTYNKKLNGKIIKCFDVAFACDFNPFYKRNIDVSTSKKDHRTFVNIKTIEECNSVPTRCIEVDSDTHTFLYGHNFMVTHNTNKDLYKNFKEEKLLAPFQDLLDMPLSIYKLQLSLYQICLEKIGLKTIARRIMWLLPNGTYDKIPLESYTKQLEEELIKHPIVLN